MPIAEIKLRRGTTIDWLLNDPVLSAGEPGYDLDTHRLKIGDGTTPWSGLMFQTIDPSTLTTMLGQVDAAVADAQAAADTAADAAASVQREVAGGVAGLDANGFLYPERLPVSAKPVFSPKDYLAVGDGSTDDSTALANTFAAAATKGIVELGGLTYKHNSRLIIPAGTTIRNGGLTTTLATTGDQGAIDVNAGDAHFESVRFNFGSAARFGVYADQVGAKNITIRGCTATGTTSHAFCFNDKVTDSEISGNTLTGVVYGIRVRGACQRIRVNRNVITQWLSYGIEVRGVSGVGAPSVIETNDNIGSNPQGGDPNVVTGRAGQLVRYLGAADAVTTDAQCSRNICVGPSLAFNPGTNNNATGDQIGMQFVDRFICDDNTMLEGGENGISITDGCTNGEVAGNVCAGNDGHGIQISRVGAQAANCTIHHNICYNNNQDRLVNNGGLCAGIFIQDSLSCTVHNNRCYDSQTPKKQNSGILISTATDMSLYGNDLAGNKTIRLSEQGTRTYVRKEDGDTYVFGDGNGAPIMRINGAIAQRREFRFQSNALDRWRLYVNSAAETGAGAGSNFSIDAMDDAGAVATRVLDITRASGMWTIPALTVGQLVPATFTIASTATLTVDASAYTRAKVTAQAAALNIANPTGTPVAMQGLIVRVKDNGTARALTYGTQFRAVGVTLPATTVINKTVYLGCVWNSDDTRWDVIAVSQEQ